MVNAIIVIAIIVAAIISALTFYVTKKAYDTQDRLDQQERESQ